MKKILVVAMMALFAVSAFALDATFKGKSEFKGELFLNGSASKQNAEGKKEERTQANFYQFLRLWSTISIDDVVTLDLRATPVKDRIWGTAGYNKDVVDYTGEFKLDRAYLTLKFNDLKVVLGDMPVNDEYAVMFGTVHRLFGDGGTHGDGIKVSYKFNDDMYAYFSYEKLNETQWGLDARHKFGNNNKSKDSDNYVLGADLTVEGIRITPSVSYQTDVEIKDYSKFAGHVSAVYDSTDLEIKGAVAFVSDSGKPNGNDKVETQAFGAYIDGAYKTPDFKVGGLFAYGTADKKKGQFAFGDDFGQTYIVDGEYFDGTGAAGVMTVQAYAAFNIMTDLTANARLAYYKSNLAKDDKIENEHSGSQAKVVRFNDKSSVIEIDADVTYQLTKSTSLTAGAAYAINTDVYNAQDYVAGGDDNKKIDNIGAFRWVLTTYF